MAVGDVVGVAGASRVDAQTWQQYLVQYPWLAEYAFLITSENDIEILVDANYEAMHTGVDLLTALFTIGHITPDRYTNALAQALDVPVAGYQVSFDPKAIREHVKLTAWRAIPIRGFWRGSPARIVCATDAPPHIIAARVANAARMARVPVVLVTAPALQLTVEDASAASNLRTATTGLKRHLPLYSAGRAGPQWQPISMAILIGLIVGAMTAHPQGTLALLSVTLTIPFLGTVLVRLMAMAGLFRRNHAVSRLSRRIPDRDLPIYSVMVALYDEAEVLPRLIAGLAALDYPATKLDCLLVIEDGDSATKAALLKTEVPAFMRIIVVPDGEPRTKPRALNYALELARGEYVVIYDAEDRPEADQLRLALAAFHTSAAASSANAKLACVQACLNIYNPRQSWLTRQFTVEYSALFDSVLPALQRLRLPMPLGGTSNHFPRSILSELHGWDPYNVTEDADLGIRIARLGYSVSMINSTTWEEAPATFGLWLRQRTRWLKGWMQTYLVHTRQPLSLMRDLGIVRTLGFHLYLGGLILSALVHPLFYLTIIAEHVFDIHQDILGQVAGPFLWYLSVANLMAGYLASIIVGVVSQHRRKQRLTLSALFMPFYWLLISMAAYRAIWQLYKDPFLWEKTPHGLAEE